MDVTVRGVVVARRDAGRATLLTVDEGARTFRVLVVDASRGVLATWTARPVAALGARVEVTGVERPYDGAGSVIQTETVTCLDGAE